MSHLSSCLKLSLALALGCAGVALGDPPAVWCVQFTLHETPSDPNSPVTFVIELDLASDEVNGSAVGWAVTRVQIQREDEQTSTVYTWSDETPVVGTQDGLWWLTHADPNDPRIEEFTQPPALAGTGVETYQEQPDLDYDLEGHTYTPPEPPAQPPYAVTALLDWRLQYADEQEPVSEEDQGAADVATD